MEDGQSLSHEEPFKADRGFVVGAGTGACPPSSPPRPARQPRVLPLRHNLAKFHDRVPAPPENIMPAFDKFITNALLRKTLGLSGRKLDLAGLIALLKDEDYRRVSYATGELGKLAAAGSRRALDALLSTLGDEKSTTRSFAATALGTLGVSPGVVAG